MSPWNQAGVNRLIIGSLAIEKPEGGSGSPLPAKRRSKVSRCAPLLSKRVQDLPCCSAASATVPVPAWGSSTRPEPMAMQRVANSRGNSGGALAECGGGIVQMVLLRRNLDPTALGIVQSLPARMKTLA